MVSVKQLSCQSSVEPSVPEEEINDVGEKETRVVIESVNDVSKQPRTDSLILNTATIEETSVADSKKFLYRSQSTRSFKKPKLKPSKLLSSDLDQIYVISSNACTRDDFYDSIEVISERRSKNFMGENSGGGGEGACDKRGNNNEMTTNENTTTAAVVEIES